MWVGLPASLDIGLLKYETDPGWLSHCFRRWTRGCVALASAIAKGTSQLGRVRLTRHIPAAQRGEMASLNGRLGLALFDDRYLQDPYPLYEQMHQEGHVHRIGESDFYAVSSWAAVNEAVTRCDDFSSNLTATMM